MSFIEFETWCVQAGNEADHDQMIRDCHAQTRTNHADLFAEWKSAEFWQPQERNLWFEFP